MYNVVLRNRGSTAGPSRKISSDSKSRPRSRRGSATLALQGGNPYDGGYDAFDSVLMNPFASMRQMELEMQRQMRQMDRMQEEMERQFAESQRTLPPGQNYRYDREESVNRDGYRSYYRESIVVYNGGYIAPAPAQVQVAQGGGLAGILVALAALYAAVAARFWSNFHSHTTYRPEEKPKLVLLWPVLVVFSAKFREQWAEAMRGAGRPVKQGGEGDRRDTVTREQKVSKEFEGQMGQAEEGRRADKDLERGA